MGLNSEKAFDMLPFAVDMFYKLDIKEFSKNRVSEIKNLKGDKEAIQKALGEEMIRYIVKNLSKVKEEFFNILAVYQEISLCEAKQQNLTITINVFKEIFSDKDLLDFFKQAMQ